MKRIIALFLTFLLVFTFIGCDKDENGKPIIDEAAWKKAAEIANFDNVTMKMSVIMSEGEGDFVIKLDGNKAVVDGIFTEDEVTVSGCKDIYVKTSLAMAENFSDFVYDAETDSFKSNKKIEYDATVQGIDAHITTENVIVKLDTKNLITVIECDMKQEFNDGSEDQCFELHVTFTFSDYGKTVAEP